MLQSSVAKAASSRPVSAVDRLSSFLLRITALALTVVLFAVLPAVLFDLLPARLRVRLVDDPLLGAVGTTG